MEVRGDVCLRRRRVRGYVAKFGRVDDWGGVGGCDCVCGRDIWCECGWFCESVVDVGGEDG